MYVAKMAEGKGEKSTKARSTACILRHSSVHTNSLRFHRWKGSLGPRQKAYVYSREPVYRVDDLVVTKYFRDLGNGGGFGIETKTQYK